MQDDGFYGVVVSIFLELVDNSFGVKNDPLEVDNRDLVPEAAGKRSLLSGTQGDVDKREHSQDEKEEGASSYQDPKQGARTFAICHSLPCEGVSVALRLFPVSSFEWLSSLPPATSIAGVDADAGSPPLTVYCSKAGSIRH